MKDIEIEFEWCDEDNVVEFFDTKSKTWIKTNEFYKRKCLEALRQSGILVDSGLETCKEEAETMRAIDEAIDEGLALYGDWEIFYKYGIDECIERCKSIKQTKS